jgi:hypothetical protein
MESRRCTHTAGVEAQNKAVKGLYANGCRFVTLTLNIKKRSRAINIITGKEGNTL